jgi:DNA polymerase-3 subunit alpha
MEYLSRFEPHSHTTFSNIRLLDCINSPEALIDRAVQLGLNGIAITDHESLGSAVIIKKYEKIIQESNPNFKVAIGDEIYLTKDRRNGQKYYHFILIAKNEIGFRALKEISSKAWLNGYTDRRMFRVPITYDELEKIIKKFPNSIMATTACLGGQTSSKLSELIQAEKAGDEATAAIIHNELVDFILWCKELFGEDFYIECAPGCSHEQIEVNKRLKSLADCFNLPMVIGTDAHFLKKEDRYVHKAYLTSKPGDGNREVDAFYEYAYLQSNEEIINHLSQSNFLRQEVLQMFDNSIKMYDKIKNYDIFKTQQIPPVPVKDYPKTDWFKNEEFDYPNLKNMFTSDNKVERNWVNQCWTALNEKIGNWKEHRNYVEELEEEARVKKVISGKLHNNMFQYPITLQYYIDMIWECGSTIGAGRGSACAALNHYLLGITQLDPVEYNLPFFRYLNDEREELGDIDIDLAPSKRPTIIKKIKNERRQYLNQDLDEEFLKELGATFVATYGTENTKSAILAGCRGYRSEDYPEGIMPEDAQYLSSLIPVERGFNWTLKDAYYGNKEKGRYYVKLFRAEMDNYPRLLEIISGIENIIKSRGIHASGVVFFDGDPFETTAFMRAPSGEVVTQFDLHDVEYCGGTKFDFLLTKIQDKITTFINLLQKEKIIEEGSLREIYNKYFHPSKLPLDRDKIWTAIENNEVLDLFQFDSDVGRQAAKKIKPKTIMELSDANGLLRLMPEEKNAETPLDKYVRYKNNIGLWYKEMADNGLTNEEIKYIEPYFKSSYGVPPSQEQMMLMLMDPHICNFTLKAANAARKIVAKKQMDKIPELKEKIEKQALSPSLGKYIWMYGVTPQLGYSFSVIHALAYSFIGVQCAYSATNWNPIFWNTACLIVNTDSLETDDWDAEDEDEVVEVKEKAKDYGKLATAIGAIRSRGIKLSLIDINNSDYTFIPDVKNNEILFGLKGCNKINNNVIEQIKAGRPYSSIKDFMVRCPLSKPIMVSLIKAGAFDKLDYEWARKICSEPRIAIMAYYISIISEPKTNLTLQNFTSLMKYHLIPDELAETKKLFEFNKYIKQLSKKTKEYYILDNAAYNYYKKFYDEELLESFNNSICIKQKTWDKIYSYEMDKVREWLKENKTQILQQLNSILFKQTWEKYANKNISAWEMESLCFYYHDHELANIDFEKYGISDFNNLNDREISSYFKRNGREIPLYKISTIVGTVIAKNDTKATINLLTPTGVVPVKFGKEYYSMFKKRISRLNPETNKKQIVEEGWFKKGTLLMINGYRRDDTFVSKTYKNTNAHQLYKIVNVKGRDIILTHEREKGEEDE